MSEQASVDVTEGGGSTADLLRDLGEGPAQESPGALIQCRQTFAEEYFDVARAKGRDLFRAFLHGRSWTRTRDLRLIRAAL
jgi:hypothetical protein